MPYKFRKYSEIKIFDRPGNITHSINIEDSRHINILNSIDKVSLGMIIDKIHKGEELDDVEIKEIQTPLIDTFDEQQLSSSSEGGSSSDDEEFEYSKDYN